MTNLKIGGVPEHFNYPWYIALKNKYFQKQDINLRWVDYYGGTGQMSKALRDKEIDLAVILTEGVIKEITEENPVKIVQVYVSSPLIWGIHVANHSTYQKVDQLKGTKAAISRYGSGSHLMAYINAKNHQWNIENDLQFCVVQDLDGALKNLPEGNGDYFMWEKFTTKPYVDSKIFRRIGECPTPWPCFVIAVREECLEKQPETIKTILDIINNVTKNFKNIDTIDKLLSQRYDQKIEDIQQWLEITTWSDLQLNTDKLSQIQNELFQLKIIDKKLPLENFLYNL